MSLTAYILEDELLAKNRLLRMISEVAPDINVIASFESVEELAISMTDNNIQPDLLFLDIHVSDGSSFELFHLMEIKSKVIFTTAFDKYAIEAFRKSAIDYLLKPIKKDQLAEAIQKASHMVGLNQQLFSSEYKSRILINFGRRLISLKVSDIAYIFSKNKISYFVSHKGDRFPSDYKLQELEKLLDPIFFARANRQYIVHIDSISAILRHDSSRLKLTLEPEAETDIVVSTEKTKFFKAWLKK